MISSVQKVTIQRVQTPEALSQVASLADKVFFSGKKFFQIRYPHVFSLQNGANLLFVEADGHPVSFMAGYPSELLFPGGYRLKTFSIGVVCTEEAYRGKGYSTALLKEMDRLAREAGAQMILISGTGKLYTDYGAQSWGTLTEIHLERKDFIPLESVPVYRRYDSPSSALTEAVYRLYCQELPRFNRTREELSLMLQGHLSPMEGERACVLLLDPPNEGYAVLRTLWEGNTRLSFLVEYGGNLIKVWQAVQGEAYREGSHKAFVRVPGDVTQIPPLEFTNRWTTPITGTIKFLIPPPDIPSFRVDTLNFL